MSHASIIEYLKTGFHHKNIPWGFNADHQPIGGRFDKIEKELVDGSMFASYITYDLSPELSSYTIIDNTDELDNVFNEIVDIGIYNRTCERLDELEFEIDKFTIKQLVTYLTPSMNKLKKRDNAYIEIRKENFSTPEGRRFFKELSIDELPGQTKVETMAVCLAMADALDIKFQYVAPNIGFQKNFPYDNNEELEEKIATLYTVAKKFGVSIGFHSGSGKSYENYSICGQVTQGNFEIKTSGRYTYEMGVALSQSSNADDKALWNEWYTFTKKLAIEGAFSDNDVQKKFAREFITHALNKENISADKAFVSRDGLTTLLEQLPPSPDHMFWFEYNFLFVLAAQGSSEKLGDHGVDGYKQRKRFYTISDEGKLLFAKNIASYIVFLAESTGIVEKSKAKEIHDNLASVSSYESFLEQIFS